MPQLAPNATGRRRGARAGASPPRWSRPSWCGRGYRRSWSRRPAGRSRAAPATAASSSSTAEIVSIHSTSQPPSASASACSANAASPGLAGRARRSARRSRRSAPSSPRPAPAGRRRRRPRGRGAPPPGSARRRAPARHAGARRIRLPPKLLVRMRSEPASTKLWWTARTRSGCSRFHSSGDAAGLEAEREQAGAHGAVGDHHRPAGEQIAQRIGHGSQRELGQAAPPAPCRRRGRLSAALVRPAARRRARRCCTMARRSASSRGRPAAISSSVRMQPAHRPGVGSSRHTPTHGEGISFIRRSSFQARAAHRPVGQIEDQRALRKRRHRVEGPTGRARALLGSHARAAPPSSPASGSPCPAELTRDVTLSCADPPPSSARPGHVGRLARRDAAAALGPRITPAFELTAAKLPVSDQRSSGGAAPARSGRPATTGEAE